MTNDRPFTGAVQDSQWSPSVKFDYCCHGIERKDCEQCSRALPSSMTSTLDDARGELREAITNAIIANMTRLNGMVHTVDAIMEAIRAAPVTQCDAVTEVLRQNIQSKLKQLKHYRDHDCQLDHAKTIAEGRIIQLEQVAHWIATEYAAPVPKCTDVPDLCDRLRAFHSKIMNEAADALEQEVKNWKQRNRDALAAEARLAAVVRVIDDKLAQYQEIDQSKHGLTDLGHHAWIAVRVLRENVGYAMDSRGDVGGSP